MLRSSATSLCWFPRLKRRPGPKKGAPDILRFPFRRGKLKDASTKVRGWHVEVLANEPCANDDVDKATLELLKKNGLAAEARTHVLNAPNMRALKPFSFNKGQT